MSICPYVCQFSVHCFTNCIHAAGRIMTLVFLVSWKTAVRATSTLFPLCLSVPSFLQVTQCFCTAILSILKNVRMLKNLNYELCFLDSFIHTFRERETERGRTEHAGVCAVREQYILYVCMLSAKPESNATQQDKGTFNCLDSVNHMQKAEYVHCSLTCENTTCFYWIGFQKDPSENMTNVSGCHHITRHYDYYY